MSTTAECPRTVAPDARTLNRDGIARAMRGDLAGALADFWLSAETDPAYAEPWNNSGLVRQRLGQFAQAVADFDRALAVRPGYPEALNNRGHARQANGDAAGARADYDAALEVAAGAYVASVLHNRGSLRMAAGDPDGARADFDRAIAVDPAPAGTWVLRAEARKDAGDLDGARADLEAALGRAAPHQRAAVLHQRGGVRVLQADFAGAIADYDAALADDPQNAFYYVSRGNARYHRRDARALVDYRMAFRLDPEATAREFLRILRADVRRDAQDVLENCDKHLRISAHDRIAYARRGFTLLLLGRAAEAAADLSALTRLAPDWGAELERVARLVQATRTAK